MDRYKDTKRAGHSKHHHQNKSSKRRKDIVQKHMRIVNARVAPGSDHSNISISRNRITQKLGLFMNQKKGRLHDSVTTKGLDQARRDLNRIVGKRDQSRSPAFKRRSSSSNDRHSENYELDVGPSTSGVALKKTDWDVAENEPKNTTAFPSIRHKIGSKDLNPILEKKTQGREEHGRWKPEVNVSAWSRGTHTHVVATDKRVLPQRDDFPDETPMEEISKRLLSALPHLGDTYSRNNLQKVYSALVTTNPNLVQMNDDEDNGENQVPSGENTSYNRPALPIASPDDFQMMFTSQSEPEAIPSVFGEFSTSHFSSPFKNNVENKQSFDLGENALSPAAAFGFHNQTSFISQSQTIWHNVEKHHYF